MTGRDAVLVQDGGADFDFYIGPSGSDGNAGTLGSPWAITALATKSQIAGTRVGLLDGTYVLSDTSGKNPGDNDGIQYILYGGTEGDPTIIEAVNHLQAVITTNNGGNYPQGSGSGQGSWPALQIRAGVDYVTIRGIHFHQFSFAPISVRGSHVLIEDCEINDVDHSRDAFYDAPDNCGGIMSGSDGTDLIIRNCKIHDIYKSGTTADTNQGCIGPLYNYGDLLVENCTLYNSGIGIGPKDGFGKITIRNNFVHSVLAYAIRSMCEQEVGSTPVGGDIHHNIFANIPNLTGSDNPQGSMAPRATDFYNNTVVYNSSISGATSGFIHHNANNTTSANRYFNNIFVLPTAVSVPNSGFMIFLAGTNNRAQDRMSVCNWNCYGQSAAKFRMQDSPTGSGYSTYSSIPWSAGSFDANSLLVDPVLVNVLGTTPGHFALQGSSQCIAAGKSNGTAGGSSVDMGAWGNTPPATIGCDF